MNNRTHSPSKIRRIGIKFALAVLIFSCTSAFCFAAEATNHNLLRTYLLLGQSNLGALGDYSTLDKEWANALERNDKIHYSGAVTGWTVSRLRPTPKGKFGLEYSFIDSISQKRPNEDILFLKHAVGGTSLYAAWNKQWTLAKAKVVREDQTKRKHNLYAKMLRKVEVLEDYARGMGYDGIDIESVVWVQGESDALTEIAAKTYKANLTQFIQNLRSDLPDPDFRFIYLQVNSMKFPHIEVVRDAQAELAEELEYVFVVKTSNLPDPEDFPKRDDGTHYNTEGAINLGNAFADRSE